MILKSDFKLNRYQKQTSLVGIVFCLLNCTPKVKSNDERQIVTAQIAEDLARPPIAFPTVPELDSVKKTKDVVEPIQTPLAESTLAKVISVLPIAPPIKRFLIGDTLKIQVKFSSPVNWIGAPTLEVLTSDPLQSLQLAATDGIGTDTVGFVYVVQAGSSDLTLSKTAPLIQNASGGFQRVDGLGSVDLSISELSLVDFEIVRSQSNPTGVTLPDSNLFFDSFEFFVSFSSAVNLRGFPYIDVKTNTISPSGVERTRRAFAVRTEQNKAVFRYNVQSDDADTGDGASIARTVNPLDPQSTGAAIVGANGNPVKTDLNALLWPTDKVLKVEPLIPGASLYAQFRAQSGDVFANSSPDGQSCALSLATPWANGEKIGCWQPQDKSSPFLSQQGNTELEMPTVMSLPQVLNLSPFVRFLPNGNKPGLAFPVGSFPIFTQNSARFVAVAFHVQSEVNNQPLLWLDQNQGVFANPGESKLVLKSGTREAFVPVTFALGKTVVVGFWDSGSVTTVRLWKPDDVAPQILALQFPPAAATMNVFNWPFDGLKLGGRKETAAPAFEGGVNEIMLFGSLSDPDQNKVMCNLAKKHHNFLGACP